MRGGNPLESHLPSHRLCLMQARVRLPSVLPPPVTTATSPSLPPQPRAQPAVCHVGSGRGCCGGEGRSTDATRGARTTTLAAPSLARSLTRAPPDRPMIRSVDVAHRFPCFRRRSPRCTGEREGREQKLRGRRQHGNSR